MRPLNLASQPFRNETLAAILFGAASVVLVAGTIHHAFVVRGLLPARTSALHREVADLEAETERLRAEARTLKAPKPEKQVIAEWTVLKDLVDRRTFSWTGLFARLELVLPREIRLVSIAPDVEHGRVSLDITAVARPSQAGLGLVGLLEQRDEFEDVYPVSVAERDGGVAEFTYTMRYLPATASDATLAPAAEAETVATEMDEEPEQPEPSAAPRPGPEKREKPTERSEPPAQKRPGPLPSAAARPTPEEPPERPEATPPRSKRAPEHQR